jgi:hypothetical protein
MSKDGDDESYGSSSEGSVDKKLMEDPYDTKPEFSETPPHDTTSFKLENDEELLFYQRSRFPICCMLAHTESEVVITKRRVIITQADQLRGLPVIAPWGFPYRMRQHVVSRDKIAGYSSGAVQPRCWHLCLGSVLLLVSMVFIIGGNGAIVLALRALNPMSWMRTFGGSRCRELGLCGGGEPSSSLMQLSPAVAEVPLSTAKLEQADPRQNDHQRGSFLELRPSGHMLKHQRLGAAKTVLSPGPPSSFLETGESAVARTGSDTAPPEKKIQPDTCTDFDGWVDSDGATCEAYRNGHWALSCTGWGAGAGASSGDAAQRISGRRDNSALRLSALEACCVCGGGSVEGQRLGAARLVDAMWPAVLAVSGSDGKAGEAANLISSAGKAVVKEGFRQMQAKDLKKYADVVAKIRTGELVAGLLEAPGDLEDMLVNLAQEKHVAQVNKGLGAQPLPLLTMYALDVDMRDIDANGKAQNQATMENYARWAHFQTFLLCILKAVNFICLFVGLGLIGKWYLDQRWSQDRLYVVLKVHRDFFGDTSDPCQAEGQKPFAKNNHKIEQMLGFYLPGFSYGPYRLREMSNALMSPCDADAGAKQEQASLLTSKTVASLDSAATLTTQKSMKSTAPGGTSKVKFKAGSDSE